MPLVASRLPDRRELLAALRQGIGAAEALLDDAMRAVRHRLVSESRNHLHVFEREQRATHGLAWFATYAEAIRQLAAYAERIHATGALLFVELGIDVVMIALKSGNVALNFVAAGLWASVVVAAGYAFGQLSEKVMNDASSSVGIVMLVAFLGLSWLLSRKLERVVEKS